MSDLRFQNPAEAVACVAVLMLAADGSASEAEVQFLFERVCTIPVFDGYDPPAFRALVNKMSGAMHDVVKQDENGLITDAGLDVVAAAVGAAVASNDWPMVLKVAEAVGRSDGLEAAEQRVLDHLTAVLSPG
jgi:hypothetical protein